MTNKPRISIGGATRGRIKSFALHFGAVMSHEELKRKEATTAGVPLTPTSLPLRSIEGGAIEQSYEDEAPRGDRSYAVRFDYGIPVVAFKPVCDCCHSHAATHGAYCHACSVAIEQEQRS